MIGKPFAVGFLAICLGLSALAITVLTGCGTLVNVIAPREPDPGATASEPRAQLRPYGGVLTDAQWAWWVLRNEGLFWLAPYIVAVDLPCSVVGDTVTLPWVLYRLGQPDTTAVPAAGGAAPRD